MSEAERDAVEFLNKRVDETHTKWINAKEQYPKGDFEHLVYVKNAGELRLGCLISVFRKDVDFSEERWNEFLSVSYPFMFLGFVDNLVEIVVDYQ